MKRTLVAIVMACSAVLLAVPVSAHPDSCAAVVQVGPVHQHVAC